MSMAAPLVRAMIAGVLGRRLAAARKRAGMTQAELAAALGERYDQSVVSAVERDRTALRLEGAVRAARALSVSLDYLVGLTDDPEPDRGSTGNEREGPLGIDDLHRRLSEAMRLAKALRSQPNLSPSTRLQIELVQSVVSGLLRALSNRQPPPRPE